MNRADERSSRKANENSDLTVLLFWIAGGLLSAAVCIPVFFAILPLWKPFGEVLLVQVSGNSMLPTLDGGTVYETCTQCGIHAPRGNCGTSICPNCGWLTHERERSTAAYRKVSRQEIRYSPLLQTVPQKNYEIDDIVVLTPNKETGPVIKRIVGLPGDILEVRNGVLYRNGARSIRSLECWKQMRIPVCLDDFRPNGISRWIPISASFLAGPDSPESSAAVTPMPQGWIFSSSEPAGILYAHQSGRFVPSSDGKPICRMEPAPITSQRAENGTQCPVDSIFLIDELLCTFTLSLEPQEIDAANALKGPEYPNAANAQMKAETDTETKTETEPYLAISLPTLEGEHFFILAAGTVSSGKLRAEIEEMARRGTFQSLAGGEKRASIYRIPIRFPEEDGPRTAEVPFRVTVSTLDGIARLSINEQLQKETIVFDLPEEDVFLPSTKNSESKTGFLSFEETNGRSSTQKFPYSSTARIWGWGQRKIEIKHLALFRGEYWEDFLMNFHYFAQNPKKSLDFSCGSEYYVVGDNFFVSEDSRHWGTISPQQIHGKVKISR